MIAAPAKVNLTLHVTGQRADGYHLLDSLVVFADVGDRLRFADGDMRITVTGPFAEGVPRDARNLVWQAAELAGWQGHITLEKNLPHGAGIGGGSADAAAVLRQFGGHEGALTLGADVPVCLSPAAQRMRGIGEVCTPAPPLPDFEMVLVNPGVAVPTGPVFAALASKDNPPMPQILPQWSGFEDFCAWLADQRNDLEPPARRLVPEIGTALSRLDAAGARLSRMSGSGATCFGLFAGGAAKAAEVLRRAHPDWWVVACRPLGIS
ncbi:4-(cytidine 5'-diphospho)-2-C-methyl-D-erythritol kinase [Sulfitobacter sp. HNIBRBA3233]|uniref:4-(cytidine 5'-diphospho)-2-C-methyl-D-erythritol kinase n=1 Tax=Sulfitobacter marinivivus TaxID=3158558 RepID=UPI0032DF96D6